jgi:hypothetical protein
MTSCLVVIPTRRAHSNHEQVARSIGIDPALRGPAATEAGKRDAE